MKGQGGDNDEDNNDDDDNDGDDDDGDDGDDDNSAKDDGGGRWGRQRRGRNLFSGIYSIPSFRSLRNRSRSNCYGVHVPSIEWSRFFQLMLRDRIPRVLVVVMIYLRRCSIGLCVFYICIYIDRGTF